MDRGEGVVRGKELVCETRDQQISGRKLPPYGEGGRAVLLEDIAAIEVAIVIEMIVDRGVDGGKFLQGLDVPELCHRTLSSSKWLVRVFRPIIEPTSTLLAPHDPNRFHRSAV